MSTYANSVLRAPSDDQNHADQEGVINGSKKSNKNQCHCKKNANPRLHPMFTHKKSESCMQQKFCHPTIFNQRTCNRPANILESEKVMNQTYNIYDESFKDAQDINLPKFSLNRTFSIPENNSKINLNSCFSNSSSSEPSQISMIHETYSIPKPTLNHTFSIPETSCNTNFNAHHSERIDDNQRSAQKSSFIFDINDSSFQGNKNCDYSSDSSEDSIDSSRKKKSPSKTLNIKIKVNQRYIIDYDKPHEMFHNPVSLIKKLLTDTINNLDKSNCACNNAYNFRKNPKFNLNATFKTNDAGQKPRSFQRSEGTQSKSFTEKSCAKCPKFSKNSDILSQSLSDFRPENLEKCRSNGSADESIEYLHKASNNIKKLFNSYANDMQSQDNSQIYTDPASMKKLSTETYVIKSCSYNYQEVVKPLVSPADSKDMFSSKSEDKFNSNLISEHPEINSKHDTFTTSDNLFCSPGSSNIKHGTYTVTSNKVCSSTNRRRPSNLLECQSLNSSNIIESSLQVDHIKKCSSSSSNNSKTNNDQLSLQLLKKLETTHSVELNVNKLTSRIFSMGSCFGQRDNTLDVSNEDKIGSLNNIENKILSFSSEEVPQHCPSASLNAENYRKLCSCKNRTSSKFTSGKSCKTNSQSLISSFCMLKQLFDEINTAVEKNSQSIFSNSEEFFYSSYCYERSSVARKETDSIKRLSQDILFLFGNSNEAYNHFVKNIHQNAVSTQKSEILPDPTINLGSSAHFSQCRETDPAKANLFSSQVSCPCLQAPSQITMSLFEEEREKSISNLHAERKKKFNSFIVNSQNLSSERNKNLLQDAVNNLPQKIFEGDCEIKINALNEGFLVSSNSLRESSLILNENCSKHGNLSKNSLNHLKNKEGKYEALKKESIQNENGKDEDSKSKFLATNAEKNISIECSKIPSNSSSETNFSPHNELNNHQREFLEDCKSLQIPSPSIIISKKDSHTPNNNSNIEICQRSLNIGSPDCLPSQVSVSYETNSRKRRKIENNNEVNLEEKSNFKKTSCQILVNSEWSSCQQKKEVISLNSFSRKRKLATLNVQESVKKICVSPTRFSEPSVKVFNRNLIEGNSRGEDIKLIHAKLAKQQNVKNEEDLAPNTLGKISMRSKRRKIFLQEKIKNNRLKKKRKKSLVNLECSFERNNERKDIHHSKQNSSSQQIHVPVQLPMLNYFCINTGRISQDFLAFHRLLPSVQLHRIDKDLHAKPLGVEKKFSAQHHTSMEKKASSVSSLDRNIGNLENLAEPKNSIKSGKSGSGESIQNRCNPLHVDKLGKNQKQKSGSTSIQKNVSLSKRRIVLKACLKQISPRISENIVSAVCLSCKTLNPYRLVKKYIHLPDNNFWPNNKVPVCVSPECNEKPLLHGIFNAKISLMSEKRRYLVARVDGDEAEYFFGCTPSEFFKNESHKNKIQAKIQQLLICTETSNPDSKPENCVFKCYNLEYQHDQSVIRIVNTRLFDE